MAYQFAFAADRTLTLSWYSDRVLRVHVGTSMPVRRSLSVVAQPDDNAAWDVEESDDRVELSSGSLTVQIDSAGCLRFLKYGEEFLRESGRSFPTNDLPNAEDRVGAEQRFVLQNADALYGLGQYQDGVMNRRNTKLTLIHGNVTVVNPFLVSTGGWGILWDNPSHTEFEDNAEGMRLWSEVADGVDYYLCVGDSVHDVISGYRLLTGHTPLYPRGFYGFIQCKERYKTAKEMTEVVAEHRRRQLPLDVIVQDWQYWGKGMSNWSGMSYDPDVYGDLPTAVEDIHAMHASVMISIWPRIGLGSDLAKELGAKGKLFDGHPDHLDKVYDAFDEEAREIYWNYAKKGLFDLGIDAWWMDGTEPEFEDCHDPKIHKASLIKQRDTAAGSWARVLNAFCLETVKGVYTNQRKETEDKRVFILTRSAFAGQQAYGAATWSGDISASWDRLQKQIPAGLNFCASGIPYWTTDNGAFFVRGRGGTFPQGCEDPAFREFFLRWTQYSVFCPLMRSHGTQTPREAWHYGEPGEVIYDGLVDAMKLRMRLLPYTYSLAHEAWNQGGSPMLPLGLDFPDDAHAADIDDQFMYGSALMACPVTNPMVHAPTEHIDALTSPQAHHRRNHGLLRRVFDGVDSNKIVHEKHVSHEMDNSWSGNLPPGASSSSYRVEFSGDLRRNPSMSSKLMLRVAGRLRVHIDGDLVIDDWCDGPLRECTIELPQTDRDLLPFVVEYGHTEGDAVLKFGYELAGQWGDLRGTQHVRDVYLPEGDWFDFYTNAKMSGGQTRTVEAPLSHIPVYAPAGSILPLGVGKQWHNETPDDCLEIRVYPGANATFTLFEDAGNSYAYERGERSAIPFRWDDASGQLHIGERRGSFPGMLENRRFVVNVIGGPTRKIEYDGSRT